MLTDVVQVRGQEGRGWQVSLVKSIWKHWTKQSLTGFLPPGLPQPFDMQMLL